jgi:hypothetical protein
MSDDISSKIIDEEVRLLFEKHISEFQNDNAACFANIILIYGISPSRILKMNLGFCKQTLYNKLNSLMNGDYIRKSVLFVYIYFFLGEATKFKHSKRKTTFFSN